MHGASDLPIFSCIHNFITSICFSYLFNFPTFTHTETYKGTFCMALNIYVKYIFTSYVEGHVENKNDQSFF